MKKSKVSHNRILIEIILGIVIGIVLGGFFPEFATKLSFLGDIFLNALMMIVVPVVIFSIISGITGIGNFKNLGIMGRNTIVYYLITTALSVILGLFLVNILQPGKNVSTGEKLLTATYTINTDNNHILEFDGKLEKDTYDNKYKVYLIDQGVFGVIEKVEGKRIFLNYWEPENRENIIFIDQDDSVLPFKIVDKQLISAEPSLAASGKGFEISLAYNSSTTSQSGSVASTLKRVITGDKAKGQEGLIPRNIFNAMARMEILPLITFSLLIGCVITIMGEKGKSLVNLFNSFNEMFMILTGWIIELAPFGVMGLIGARIGQEGGFSNFIPELVAVGKYSLTILIGLGVHGFVVLPLILIIFGKRNPWRYANGMATALLNAFSSASSSATLPLTINEAEVNNNISSKTAGFVLPLGATINMDGTALYEAVAAMFIAQIYGIDLGFSQQLIIFLTATLAAIGAAGIPQAGLVTMVIVLKAVHLPVEGIGMILTVDWLLDRFRTTVNVWGDSVGCAVVDNYKKK